DYAGLFPPAKLPLEEAIRNYARYRTEPEAWMLGSFICPVSKIDELQALWLLLHEGPPIAISWLGSAAQAPLEFEQTISDDLCAVANVGLLFDGRVRTRVYETRMPDQVVVRAQAADLAMILEASANINVPPDCFFEVGFRGAAAESMTGLAKAIRE